jgi:hypothetical protein
VGRRGQGFKSENVGGVAGEIEGEEVSEINLDFGFLILD